MESPHFVLSFPLSPSAKAPARRGHGVGHKAAPLCQGGDRSWGPPVSPLCPWKVTQGIYLEGVCSGGSSWFLGEHRSSKAQQLHPHRVFYPNQDNLLPDKHGLVKIPWLCFQVNVQDRSQTPPAAGDKYRAAQGWALHWEAEQKRWEFTQSI